MEKRRVVITGLGSISALGHTVEQLWHSIQNQYSGIDRVTIFSPQDNMTQIAAEVKNFDPSNHFSAKIARRMDRFSQFALIASREAWNDAQCASVVDPTRVGIILGNGMGGFMSLEDAARTLVVRGPSHISPLSLTNSIANLAPGRIAIDINAQGITQIITTACASGTDALGYAYRSIMNGEHDVILSGGVEATITQLSFAGFDAIRAMCSSYNDNPQQACRPFDKNRDGFVMGEGAGILVLEDLAHAKKRGARIYAEFLGSGHSTDAYHIVAPHPHGNGAVIALEKTLHNAHIDTSQVDYINAHGTSTQLNDVVETQAIKTVFGDDAYRLKVSSTKAMHGHCIGAAGGIEALICVLALKEQYFPPTLNIDTPDTECDLDYVPHHGYHGTISVALSNSLGFGGHNACVALGLFHE